MRPIRTLVVATEIQLPGGTHGGSTHVHELVEHLRARGPTLLLARRGSHGPGVMGIGDPTHRFPPRHPHVWAANSLPAALRSAWRFRPDVIYERATSYGLGAALGVALRRPLVTMVLDQRVSPLSLWRADRLIGTEPRLVPAPFRAKTRQVGWGVNPRRFHPISPRDARRRCGLPRHGAIVAYVGSFKRWHDLYTLVRAIDQLGRRDVRVVLVGDGPRRRPVLGLVRKRGLRDRFTFTGAVPYEDVPWWMGAADVVVAPFDPRAHGPSRRLGFALDPLKVFESLAMARPTVTVDASNLRRLLDPDRHAVLVPPRQPQPLADAIARLLDRPDQARAMAEAGRAHVLAHHTWDHHVDQLHQIFAELRPHA